MRRLVIILGLTLLLGALVLTPTEASKSIPSWWVKTYGGSKYDRASAVAIAPDGDIVVAGYTNSFGAGGWDVWVLRLNKFGNILWQKTYGGSKDDRASAVTITSNGDIIIVGSTNSFGAGGTDVWVLRLYKNGTIKWQKTYGGIKEDLASAVAIAPNGDIIIAGKTCSFGVGGWDAWVIRLDPNGNIKWQKTFGGRQTDEFRAISITSGGDIILAGNAESFGYSFSALWILRLDSNGNVKWEKAYGIRGKFSWASGVTTAENGDIIVAAYTGALGPDSYDIWVLRLNSDGNVEWQKTYHRKNELNLASSVALAPNGDIVIAGSNLLRLSPEGKLNWAVELYYDYRNGCDLKILPDSTAVLTGSLNDIFVARFNIDEVPTYSGWGWKNISIEISYINGEMEPTNAEIEESYAEIHNTFAIVQNTDTEAETLWESGILKISSKPPGAKVYIDGEYKGVTPVTLELSPGIHSIKLTKENYEEYTGNVILGLGQTRSILVTLKPIEGYISVESTPSEADVYIDGDYKGKTPLILKLKVGNYTVKITKKGYKEYITTVEVKAGRTIGIAAKLDKKSITTTNGNKAKTTMTQSNSQTLPPTTTTIFPSTNSNDTTTENESSGICGPAFIIILATVPLLRRRRR